MCCVYTDGQHVDVGWEEFLGEVLIYLIVKKNVRRTKPNPKMYHASVALAVPLAFLAPGWLMTFSERWF